MCLVGLVSGGYDGEAAVGSSYAYVCYATLSAMRRRRAQRPVCAMGCCPLHAALLCLRFACAVGVRAACGSVLWQLCWLGLSMA